jgi:hypothetical protein
MDALMSARILIALCVLLLLGCSPERKLNRLLKKHPELNRVDTIRDTVWATVEYVRVDTAFKYKVGDTIVLHHDRFTVRTIVRRDTLVQTVELPPDSFPVYTETIVERVGPTEYVDRIPWWVYALGIVAVLIILAQAWKR